jgi:type II secretory pathway component GspD/PulD (secretin)
LNYITAQKAVGLLSTAFQNYVQAEAGPTGVDTYTVVVTAPPALMDRIVSDLRQIDRVPTHILLDARIVVMESGDLLNLGVEWGWPKISAGVFGSEHHGVVGESPDFGGTWPWGVQIGYTPDATFTNSLELALNLLSQNGEAQIVAKPQVLAQDGKQAEIKVMTEEYYFMTAPEVGGFYYARSELERIESGTTLTITPHIGDNNDITLQMSIEVSDSIPQGRGSDLPVITRRTANNTVRVKDGGTVALAGLTENRTRLDQKRVPGLSKIPLLGSLFRSKSDESSSREIAVFVTAHIVPEAGTVAVEQRTAPPAIQAPTIEPAGGDFQQSLRESLTRTPR